VPFVKQLIEGFRRLIRLLRQMGDRWTGRRHLSERERHRSRELCVPIDRPEFITPDPLIYDQYYLMSLGFAVTWDNPDIRVLRDGAVVGSSFLEANTVYSIEARVWNGRQSCPIIDLPVRFSYLSFGIGTVSQDIGVGKCDLGVRGGPNHPAFASINWRTPPVAGHYCIQAKLEPGSDAQWDNNLGQRNFQVLTTASPAVTQFEIHNAATTARTYEFMVDGYRIPELLPCDQTTPTTDVGERHSVQGRLLGQGWRVDISPLSPTVGPGSNQIIQVVITAPPSFTGVQAVNIAARSGSHQAGGITLYVESMGGD
jgi:hypothetical protein